MELPGMKLRSLAVTARPVVVYIYYQAKPYLNGSHRPSQDHV